MKKMSLREFIREPTKHMKNLPVLLTRYGEPVATVQRAVSAETEQRLTEKQRWRGKEESLFALKAKIDKIEKRIARKENISSTQATPVETQKRKPPKENYTNANWCKWCKKTGAIWRRYKFPDGEGEAFFCKSCWERYNKTEKSTYSIKKKVRIKPVPFTSSFPKPKKKKKRKFR